MKDPEMADPRILCTVPVLGWVLRVLGFTSLVLSFYGLGLEREWTNHSFHPRPCPRPDLRLRATILRARCGCEELRRTSTHVSPRPPSEASFSATIQRRLQAPHCTHLTAAALGVSDDSLTRCVCGKGTCARIALSVSSLTMSARGSSTAASYPAFYWGRS